MKGKGKEKMKTSINKDYTALSQLKKVKEDLKEFRGRYTDGDLKLVFMDSTGINEIWNTDVISAEVEAFPAGSLWGDDTHFHVKLITRGFRVFYEVSFYCDLNLTVDTRDLVDYRGISTGKKLYECTKYAQS